MWLPTSILRYFTQYKGFPSRFRVGVGEDFHSQLDDGKTKTTMYRLRWKGFDRRMIRTKKNPTRQASLGLDSLDQSLRDVLNDVSKNIRNISNILNRVFPWLLITMTVESALVWFVWFVSWRFVNVFMRLYHWLSNDIIKWLDYLSNHW